MCIEFLFNHLSTVGLVIDIIGAILLWKFGITATIDHEEFDAIMEYAVITSNGKYKDTVERSREKIKKVKFWSRTGLTLLIIGFVLQAIGNYTVKLPI